MKIKQTEIFDQLSATFTPEIIRKWETMVTTWNSDPTAPNPYHEPGCSAYHVLWTWGVVTDFYYSIDGPRCSSAIDEGRGGTSCSRKPSEA